MGQRPIRFEWTNLSSSKNVDECLTSFALASTPGESSDTESAEDEETEDTEGPLGTRYWLCFVDITHNFGVEGSLCGLPAGEGDQGRPALQVQGPHYLCQT